jgi:hypothetical protein
MKIRHFDMRNESSQGAAQVLDKLFFFSFFAVLELELSASHLPGRQSTT